MKVFGVVLLSYFFVTSGIAYDIINEPPAVGGEPDPVTGRFQLPVAYSTLWRMIPFLCVQAMCGQSLSCHID
jgi:hypothetical protein